MNMRLRSVFGLAGLLLVAGPLAAQEVQFGLQGTVALPTGDLGDRTYLDQALGYGFGAHAALGFANGHAVVPRLDYTHFVKSSPTRKVQMLQLGADHTWFPSGKVNQGAYLGAGLGFGLAKFEVDLPGAGADDTPNTAYGAVSAGYMFTPHMGAELRYTHAKYKPERFGAKPEVTSPAVHASFVYRF